MKILDALLETLSDTPVREVRVGLFWTAVVVEEDGGLRCGLASTMRGGDHHHTGQRAVEEAGRLREQGSLALARLVHSDSPPEVSIGMAAINATLPPCAGDESDANAEVILAQHGAGKHVALVGHFPFVARLRERVGRLSVLEQRPKGDDLPAEMAPEVIPQADMLAITSLTLLNRTFDGLMALCSPQTLVLLLGPTTPLSPVLFDHGVDILSGSAVEDIPSVLRGVSEGADFRQLHRQGVRLVTLQRETWRRK